MSFVEITKELLNETLTENGDKAYVSTLSSCLDYFALCGGKRYHLNQCASLFVKAFVEDKKTALKLLFYTRDVRGGLGERRMFRFLFNGLAVSYPEIAKKLVSYIPEYGRYDDLLCVFETPIEDYAIELISKQLEEDINNKKEGKSISLLAKWLPSINTSSSEARRLALYLCKKLNLSKADYRKTLSFLRKGLILENNLREKDYSFDYAKVPSVAMYKYQKAFSRNDQERYEGYLNDVRSGQKEMHVEVLDIVNLIKRLRKDIYDEVYDEDYYEATWNELISKAGEINKRVLVVRDGSGSMTINYGGATPLDIADAMSLYTSSRLTGEFHNKFITFSSRPQFVDLTGFNTLRDKYVELQMHDDISNTNIQKVYELILNVYKSENFKKEDAIDQILIISDMQFDYATTQQGKDLKSTFELFNEEFKKLELERPEIVFWNVDARSNQVPVTQNELGVKLVSGSSKNVVDLVMENDSFNPLDFMNKVLEAYNFIDEVFKEDI